MGSRRWLPGLVAVLLMVAAASAAAREKRIREGNFDSGQPFELTISIPQPKLVVQKFEGGGVSLIADAISSGLHERRVEAQQGGVSRLGSRIIELELPRLLQSAADRHLADVLDLVAAPAAATRQLTVRFEYYLTWELRRLQLRMTAESRAVDASPDDKPAFHQRLYFDIHAPKMTGRHKDDQYMGYWSGLESEPLRRELERGIDQLFAMLAYDVPRNFEIGHRKGRRYGTSDMDLQLVGLSIHELDGRRWVRATNGYLVNIPIE